IVAAGDSGVRVSQALPRGQRRAIAAPLPLVATIDPAAPAPRSFAFARARRGTITTIAAEVVVDDARAEWETRPARRRPRRLRPTVAGASAANRLRSLAEVRAGRGRLIVDPSPEVAAREIYEYLVAEGVLDPPAPRHPLLTGDQK
ncbi:MAG: electron transfer flavoprotein subunit beta, partial [Alphaproteobacteria bacterium]